MTVDPGVDLCGVEAQEMSPLDVGDPSLLDEAADVTNIDAEPVGHVRNADERTRLVVVVVGARRHGVAAPRRITTG
jgi:hypothetical protein